MIPGNKNHFSTVNNSKIVYETLYKLFNQFKVQNINHFKIEIYGYSIRQKKIYAIFENEIGEYNLSNKLELNRLDDFLSVSQEHNNEEIHYNVEFFLPSKSTA